MMLNISTRAQSGFEVITLEGEIDLYVAPKVREAVLQACERAGKGVLVDLTAVPYMDSSGIATLIEGLQWSRREGGHFVLAGVQEPVLDTLKLARLHELFDLFPTIQDALSTLKA